LVRHQFNVMVCFTTTTTRKGEERAPKAYTRVLSIASFNSGESRRCLLPFPSRASVQHGDRGQDHGASRTRWLDKTPAWCQGRSSGIPWRAGQLSSMHGGPAPSGLTWRRCCHACTAARRLPARLHRSIRRSRNFAFKSTGPNSERLLVLSQSRSPARVRKQTKYRLSSDTHTAYIQALIRMKLVPKMQELKENV
jgi:hypothetical protein